MLLLLLQNVRLQSVGALFMMELSATKRRLFWRNVTNLRISKDAL